MKRRALLASGLAAATVSTAWAQAPKRVGVITGLGEQDPETKARLAALRGALATLGWRDGENLTIDVRYAPDSAERARTLVAELIALKPDVAVIQGPGMPAMLEANTRIPVVFVLGGDPVGVKWVESLSHPGGTVTGFTSAEATIAAKWVEFLKEIAPEVRHIAVVAQGNFSNYRVHIDAAAQRLGLEATHVQVSTPADIESALTALAARPHGGLVLPTDAFTTAHRRQIVDLAMKYRLPLSSGTEPLGEAGGLIVYSADIVDIYRRSATYVDRILRGAKPADLPVQNPTTYRTIVNLKTAKALGLTVPPTLLARADEVIE